MNAKRQAPEGQVADAVADNWVDRYAPARMRPLLRLSRADRPIGTWLLLLPCWWGLALAMGQSGRAEAGDLWIALACAIGAFLMRGAGCTWNDLTDRKIDAQVTRTASRPLPSGQITPKGAYLWLIAQALVSFVILLTLDPAAITLGIIALLPVAIYPFAKRFTWWPQVFLGIAFNWGALLAYAAHMGAVAPAAVMLYLAGVAWTLFYDTIYAHQDREDDALIGVKSTARLFGAKTHLWLAWFGLAATGLGAGAVWLAWGDQGALRLGLGMAGVLVFGLHLLWQWRRLDINDASLCLRLFRANRDAGLLFGLFLAVGALA